MPSRNHFGLALRELLVLVASLVFVAGGVVATAPQLAREKLTTACASNIAHILGGMAAWAEENEDMILGSPSTSGADLILNFDWSIWPNLPPGPCQIWDWAGPLEQLWGFDQPNDFRDRFNQIRRRREFRCPANKWIAPAFDPKFDAGPAVVPSYNTGRDFMFPGRNGSPRFPQNRIWNQFGVGWVGGNFWPEQVPDTYGLYTNSVGNPACKVFIADGATFSTVTIPPDYTLRPHAGFGGAFSAAGVYSTFTRSWDRFAAFLDGDPEPGMRDARIYAYRHGTQDEYQPLGAYRMNVGFFDGHVTLMDDSESANPHLWLPTGTTLDRSAVHSDVAEDYFGESNRITIGNCVPPGS